MPYIDLTTNVAINGDKEELLKSKLADALEKCFPGKTENWLMINLTTSSRMYFAGSDAPCVMVNIDIFGKQSTKSYEMMTGAVCELIESECNIPSDRIYVKYSEYSNWGWNGSNF